MKTKIAINNITKAFGKLVVFKNISLNIEENEKVCIVGPSGAGKSTMLRCINSLEKVDEGSIFINGVDITTVPKKERNKAICKTGMVFQQFNLFNNLNVIENITFAPIANKLISKRDARDYAMELLKRVGLADKANCYPHQLSGGQSQRIAIVRALANKPEILLFDEPTSALDPEMVGEVQDMINDLAKTDMTIVVVTHEMGFVRQIANKVVFLDEDKLLVMNDTESFFSDKAPERVKKFLQNY